MPKIVDHEERRKEFADAAMRVAINHGVDALTVRSVAKEAGASTGALAHYFDTKDALLVAVQRSAGDSSLARIEECFETHEGRGVLEAVILTVLPLDEERRGEWRLWLAYFARAAIAVEIGRLQEGHYKRWWSDLRQAFVVACGPTASSTSAEIDAATDATMALIQGLGVLGMFEPSGLNPARQRALVNEHLDRWLPTNSR